MGRLGILALVAAVVSAGAAVAGSLDPRFAPRPEDQNRARAMLLERSDLGPGFRALPGSSSRGENRCAELDLSDLTLTGRAGSPAWLRDGTLVLSSAEVFASVGDANAWWRRQTGPSGHRCVLVQTRRSYPGKITLRRLAFPRLAPRTVAWRVGIARGVFDVIVLQRDRAHVIVAVLARRPLPREEQLRLGTIVAGRLARAMRAS